MWLIVGLGNPGPKYLLNRHNIGFMALDNFLAGLSGGGGASASPRWKDERKALTVRFKLDDVEVLFAKPQTFMNKSGESVRELLDFYKIPRERMLVVHDDIDQPLGSMKIHVNRGHGGQNGVRSIHELLGTPDYARLKLGVGRPPHPKMDVANWVLQNFSSEEQPLLNDVLNVAGDAIEAAILEGFGRAATQFNKSIAPAPGTGAPGSGAPA